MPTFDIYRNHVLLHTMQLSPQSVNGIHVSWFGDTSDRKDVIVLQFTGIENEVEIQLPESQFLSIGDEVTIRIASNEPFSEQV